jgi:hypothetical protein
MKTASKIILLFIVIGNSFLCYSQITVVPQTHTNVTLIGKISHTNAMQLGSLSRKLPTSDALKIIGDEDINSYKQLRKEANDTYKTVGVRRMTVIDEDFSASLLHFKDRNKYLLTFKNSSYHYQNESFWISEQTKLELHQLIKSELEKRIKYKNIEIILDNNVVLLLSINRKKVSFNFWDGYSWVNSYWYRLFKINNLFGMQHMN